MSRAIRLPMLLCALGVPVWAQQPDPLTALLDLPVVSASRQERKASESPAVVAVVSQADIRRRGYRSVAEALATLPGMYAIDDHLNVDMGMRGIRGGVRNANRILKVMVDYQPVSFRPDGTVSLGPDFIPMEAIDRIEVLRGPASALYGANAFLGVVHVITKRPAGDLRGAIQAVAQRERGKVGYGGEALILGGGDTLGGLGSASWEGRDRSGHGIPESSPVLRSNTVPRLESEGAWNRPGSVFLKGRWSPGDVWIHDLSLHGSRQSNVAEWLDFGTLSHQNLVAQRILTGALRSTWSPTDLLRLQGHIALSDSRPDGERLSTGSVAVHPRRDLSCRGLDASVEAQYELREGTWLVGGLDQSQDIHRLMDLYLVSNATGAAQRVYPPQGERQFRNLGAYVQVGFRPFPLGELTLNLRRDDHNVYGGQGTWRASLVVNPVERVHLKLIAGTSFKAPSPLQLFAEPIYPGDLVGNAQLRPEKARTFELSGGMDFERGLRLRAALFHTRIADLIDLTPFNTNLKPVNRDEAVSSGAEFEGGWVSRWLDLAAGLTVLDAWVLRQEPLKPEFREPTSGFPRVSGHLRASFLLPTWGSLDLQVRHASSRRSTASGTFENYFTPYALRPVTLLDAGWFLPLGDSRLHLRVQNLLDRVWADPGVRGYDLPGGRREWSLAFSVRF